MSNSSMTLVELFWPYWTSWAQYPRERGKLVLGCLFFPRSTHRWLSYLQTDSQLHLQAQVSPKLVTRIYRPYALRSLSCRERVDHMIDHHEILRESGCEALTYASCLAPLSICSWSSTDGDKIDIKLISLKDGHREGESHLQLHYNDIRLFSLTFLVRERLGIRQLLITRLQGSRKKSVSEWIRRSTKILHGLRPADLLIQSAQQFGKLLGCQQILLVSNSQRVALNPKRRLKIKVDLEKLWQERGAEKTQEGFFALSPETACRTDFSEVASNKRAQAKRRADTLRQALNAIEDLVKKYRSPIPIQTSLATPSFSNDPMAYPGVSVDFPVKSTG